MTCETAAKPPLDTAPLLEALRRSDYGAAAQLLRNSEATPEKLHGLADGLMRRRRWLGADWLFAQISERDEAVEIKRRLSRNMAALQKHRSEIYEQLLLLPKTDAFGIAASPSGRPTIFAKREDGSVVSLAGGDAPHAAGAQTLAQVQNASPNGESLALCGLGDGYLLAALAANPPALFMDMQQAVFVLEPQPQVLLHALMIHDFSGDAGPIAAERFRWFVGEHWTTEFERAVHEQPTIGVPGITLQQGFTGQPVAAHVQATLKAIADRDAAAKREIEAHYAGLTPEILPELFGPTPRIRPRVALVTTRFSTVLQHSTRDTAAAFEALGWDALVLIEPLPSHRLYQHAIRKALAEFKPHAVFQIDHLRHEHRDLFPANLPFICWGQDHLANLITPDAGRRVGELDFVLTDNPVGYARNYAYPARQLISTPKLTSSAQPAAIATAAEQVEDVVFVSNASATPETLLGKLLSEWEESQESLAVLVESAHQIIRKYAVGQTVNTYGEIRSLVADMEAATGATLSGVEHLNVCKWLTHPFNDALYRQQALRWATAAAKQLGLSVGLYGNGWDANPDFADFARGPVAYGESLRQLTRQAKFNLQIVPYLCLHQRLLDGLGAGGFFLIRQNPNDVWPQRLLNFIERHAGATARTTDAVRDALAPELIAEFESLSRAAATGILSTDGEDPVALVRDWADAGNLQTGGDVLPRLADVSFDSESRLAELFAQFKTNPSLRAEIAGEQRNAVVSRMSYTAGIARVLRRIESLLRETAQRRAPEELKQCA